MADIVIKQIEEGMTGRQVADLLYSNFLALVGAIGSGGGGDIPTADIEKGVTAYGWGDHRQAGYLKGITAGMVTGALGYTPMDEAAWTKANIKATLGIADWALAASKPAYTTKEVAEDGNLYFTDARAVAALAGVTNALAGDIGANATAIGVLQGYFTNGVAKSAAKLQTARKLWGQLFNGEADVTGALTGVTDITASGVLTIGKIKIGDGVIEWDAANGGFKVTGGLWATDYLSSKGVNTGASGGGGGGSSYQRLDTWDGYTSAKDGWVLSAKLGYGMKTTQDDILRQLADISGQGTNVTFTPALTSGTQIGTLTIDGEPVKMYAPSIPTADIEKGVTAYGWGDHSKAGYLTSASSLTWGKITGTPTTLSGYGITDAYTKSQVDSALGGYLPVSGGTINGDIYFNYRLGNYARIFFKDSRIYSGGYADEFIIFRDGDNKNVGSLGLYGDLAGVQYYYIGHNSYNGLNLRIYKNSVNWGENVLIHSGNYTDYTYSKSTIDTKLGGYLPLSGGTITSASGDLFCINRTLGNPQIRFEANGGLLGYIGFTSGNAVVRLDNTYYNIIHSGNIGSQSVASATRARYIETKKEASSDSWYGDEYMMYAQWITGDVLKLKVDGYYTLTDRAERLQTARKIWGQSFNGTADVSGALSGVSQIFFNSQNTHGIIRGNLYSSSLTEKDLVFNSPIACFDGNVGIGTTSPQYKLDVNGVIHSNTGIFSDGYVSAKGQNTSSDMRLKRVLEEVTLSVDEIAAAPAVRFAWKDGAGVDVGTSAQYWEKVLPDAVKRDDAGWLTMQYGNAAMVAVIALARRVKELEEQLKIKN